MPLWVSFPPPSSSVNLHLCLSAGEYYTTRIWVKSAWSVFQSIFWARPSLQVRSSYKNVITSCSWAARSLQVGPAPPSSRRKAVQCISARRRLSPPPIKASSCQQRGARSRGKAPWYEIAEALFCSTLQSILHFFQAGQVLPFHCKCSV